MSRAAFIVMIVAAACGTQEQPSGVVPDGPSHPDHPTDDAGIDAATSDALSDAAMDPTGPPDLAEICGGKAPVTFDDWERCYLKRWCEWQVECVPLNTYRSVLDCIASGDAVEGGRLAAEQRERSRAVDAGRASINVDNFTRCLLETGEARCNTTQSDVACATRFSGSVGDGETCYTSAECASPGAECSSACNDACCTGTCTPKFKLGQTCTDIRSCEPGLQCHRSCIAGDINTACTSDRDCDPNAWCDVQAKLCKADLAPGAACTNPLQCGGETSCVGTTISTSTPGRCLRISKPGDACDLFCYGNLYCDGTTCRALPELGQACSALTPCAGTDTQCINSSCVMRSSVGVACDNQTCLPGLFCTSELNDPNPTCAPRRTEGEPCADPTHCESYLCSGNQGSPGVCLPWQSTCP